jgi:hypothetical protein
VKELPNFNNFELRARAIFEAIPGEFRESVTALVVHPKRVAHPHLDDYETLGECESDFLSDPADERSRIHIYYGSFASLQHGDPTFDWEWELKETIEHEIKHHLEARAGHRDLEKQDWAEEQNEFRHAGKSYDPLFYRAGEEREKDEFWVDRDCFLEVRVSRSQLQRIAGKLHPVTFGEEVFEVLVPAQGGEVRHVPIEGGWVDDDGSAGDLVVVFVTPRNWIKR